jgi:hypothetical protein
MRLSQARSRQLLYVHGVYVTNICDNCRQILGHVRYTRRCVLGAWCSRACRDGVDHSPSVCRGCSTPLVGKRRGAIYCDRTCRMRTVRKQVRNSTNIVNTAIEKTGVADAILGIG